VLLGLVSLKESNYIETVYLGLLSHHPHFLSAAALFLRSRCLACALFAFLPLSRLRSLVVAVCPALRALFPLCLLVQRYRCFISAFCTSFSFPSCWVCSPATWIRQIRRFLHRKNHASRQSCAGRHIGVSVRPPDSLMHLITLNPQHDAQAPRTRTDCTSII
jgi:hypothetical protein